MTYIPGRGPLGAKLVIVIPSPSETDISTGKPLSGAEGKEVARVAHEAGFNIDNCWITSIVKEYVQPNRKGEKKIPFKKRCEMSGVNYDKYVAELRTEFSSIQPNCILGIGGDSIGPLTGKWKIDNFRGSILPAFSFKSVNTYNPSDILHGEIKGYWNRQICIFDFKRAWAQSQFAGINRPSRLLRVATSSWDLIDFRNRHRGLTRPAVDIEAKECFPVCIGIAFTPHEGLTVPLWNVKGISNISDGEMINIWRILAEILYDDIVGQNFGYDRDKIKRLGFIIRRLISDTMLKAFAINPELPKNLAFNTSIYTEEPYYKDEGMYEGSIEDLFKGCALDSCVTKEIDLKMDADIDELGVRQFYENFLLHLSPLYGEIENTGFRTNEEIRQGKLLPKYVSWAERINYELFKIAGIPINVNSPKQVDSFLYESLKIPRHKGTGEEVLTQILNNAKLKEHQKTAISLVLEKRRVDRTISNNILAAPDFDGRTRTSYFLCLETGRSSTTQQSPPIRPSIEIERKGKVKKIDLGTPFQTMTKHGDIGSDVREMYEADEGDIFIQIDSSQAEARVIFLLAEDYEALELVDRCDYHALTASWFFGGTEDDYSKKKLGYESPIRFAGKTLRHSGHLGASKRRAAIEVNTQARKYKIDYVISESESGRSLDIFHAKQPKIRGVFQKSVIDCIANTRQLVAPVPYGIDASKGGIRTFFERWGDELFRQAFSYLPQRTVSENTKAAALRIKKRAPWIKIVIEAHDALLLAVPFYRVKEAVLIAREEFERPIDFENCSIKRGKLIIPSEVETGFNYKDLSKFKLIEAA